MEVLWNPFSDDELKDISLDTFRDSEAEHDTRSMLAGFGSVHLNLFLKEAAAFGLI